MDSRRTIAAQNRARSRAERLNASRTLRMETAPTRPRPQPVQTYSPENSRRSQMWMAMLTLFCFLGTGFYWHINGSPLVQKMEGTTTVDDNILLRAFADKDVNKKLKLSGIQLGMTPAMVREVHPKANYIKDRHGKPAMTVNTPRGMMVLWLFDDSEYVQVNNELVYRQRERVFRMRLDEAYANFGESDLMATYGRMYGRPIEAACNRNQLGDTPRCTYRWWGGDGIELTAIIKRKIDANGKPYTLLTTIATNTQKDAQQASTSHNHPALLRSAS